MLLCIINLIDIELYQRVVWPKTVQNSSSIECVQLAIEVLFWGHSKWQIIARDRTNRSMPNL